MDHTTERHSLTDIITTVPVHKNDDLPKGLLREIVREDLKINLEEFRKLV